MTVPSRFSGHRDGKRPAVPTWLSRGLGLVGFGFAVAAVAAKLLHGPHWISLTVAGLLVAISGGCFWLARRTPVRKNGSDPTGSEPSTKYEG